jgi:hypothetical protein
VNGSSATSGVCSPLFLRPLNVGVVRREEVTQVGTRVTRFGDEDDRDM